MTDLAPVGAVAAILGYSSGLRLYLTVTLLGILSNLQVIHIPVALSIVSQRLTLAISVVMICFVFAVQARLSRRRLGNTVQEIFRIAGAGILVATTPGSNLDALLLTCGIIFGAMACSFQPERLVADFLQSFSKSWIQMSPSAEDVNDCLLALGLLVATIEPSAFLIGFGILTFAAGWNKLTNEDFHSHLGLIEKETIRKGRSD